MNLSLGKPGSDLARVVAVYGRQYLVRDAQGQQKRVTALGRRSDFAVGDMVTLRDADNASAAISEVHERRNILFRSDAFKQKFLSSNLDQVLVIVSGKPLFSEEFLLRAAIAADCAGIDLVVVWNKVDVDENRERLLARVAVWRGLGYHVEEVSAKAKPQETVAALQRLVIGKRSLLIGQSGMGKSTILNLLAPHARQETQEVSLALNTGKQTTTFTQAFLLDPARGAEYGELTDSPGFQAFGLEHLSLSQIQHALPEFAQRMGQCRFNNCIHANEPGCVVQAAAANAEIDAIRLEIYQRIMQAHAKQALY